MRTHRLPQAPSDGRTGPAWASQRRRSAAVLWARIQMPQWQTMYLTRAVLRGCSCSLKRPGAVVFMVPAPWHARGTSGSVETMVYLPESADRMRWGPDSYGRVTRRSAFS